MYDHDEHIDLSDIPEVTDFRVWHKNPYAEKLKNGYKILVRHNAPDGGWHEVIEVTPEEIEAANIRRDEYRQNMLKDKVVVR